MPKTNAVPEVCLMPILQTDKARQIRVFARSQSQSPELGEKPRSLLGQGAALGSPRSPLPGLGAEQRGFLMLLSDIVSGIGCLFRDEIGFRRFEGLITTGPISPWERASTQTWQVNRETALTIELWGFIKTFSLNKCLLV